MKRKEVTIVYTYMFAVDRDFGVVGVIDSLVEDASGLVIAGALGIDGLCDGTLDGTVNNELRTQHYIHQCLD